MKIKMNLSEIVALVIGFLLNIFSGFVTNILPLKWLPWVLVITSLAIFGALIWRSATRKISVKFLDPIPLSSEAEKQKYGKQGLVLCLSLFTPQAGSIMKDSTTEQVETAAKEKDYLKLDFPHSNFAVPIAAITAHRGTLKHCWLISTTSTQGATPGSFRYVEAFVAYLQDKCGMTCEFHYGSEFTIQLDYDTAIPRRARDLADSIFKSASREYGLDETSMAVDFTSGIRSISLGFILASLDSNRWLQFIGTHYDLEGKQVPNDTVPMLIDFELDIPEA